MSEGWEERAAARARTRREAREASEQAEWAAEQERATTESAPRVEEYVRELAARMTPEEARDYEPFACACVGPPPGIVGPCCCALRQMAVETVRGQGGSGRG